ncbi:MAG: DUF2207 domain-containing protein, partial [Gemmatimonadetes bacterium]|nr:DUF2207 domain-containing protein [Gemmatimonadota bacterium]
MLPTMRRLVVALALAGAALLPSSLSAQRSLEIERFDATLRVEESGWLDVREEILVRFTGSWNGIFRDIPVEYRTEQGFSFRLRLEDVSVTGESGEPLEFRSSRERHYRQLKIRVPGASDATRKVVIHYRVPNGLRFQEEYDELYWNVTGDEWEMPILAASAMVHLPPSTSGVRTASWTGGYGSTENAASVESSGGALFFETRRPLNFREGLTIAIAWNPGVVERPTALDKALGFLRANWLLVLPFLSLWAMWRLWYLRGRDPAKLAISPQYEPPEGMTPAEAGTLLDNRPDMRDLTAALVDLAVRGFLRIEEIEPSGVLGRFVGKTDYRLVPVKPREEWTGLRDHETALLTGVFGGGSGVPAPVDMSELAHQFYRNLGTIRSGIFRELVRRGYYVRRPDTVMGAYIGAAFVVGVLGVVGGLFLAETLTLSPLTAVIAAIGTALPILGFGIFMPARTVKGARALERVLGFEEFLERVESDRYKRMITSPEMFERFLPYAMAFGVEKKWAAAFEDMYTEPPDWYRGQWRGGFHPVYFAQSMGS